MPADNPRTARHRSADFSPPPDPGLQSGSASRPKPAWKNLHPLLKSWAGFVAAGALAGAVLAFAGAPPGVAGGLFGLLVAILPTILVFFGVPVAIHELGHYAVARRLGWEVAGFVVLGVPFIGGGKRNVEAGDPMGYVKVRTTLAQDRPEAWRRFIVAGSAMGLAGAAVETIALPRVPEAVVPLFGTHIAATLFINLASLWPSKPGPGMLSDGRALIDVGRADSQMFARTALVRLMPYLSGADLSEPDPEDVRRALCCAEPNRRALAASVAAGRAVLCRDPDALAILDAYERSAAAAIAEAKTDVDQRTFRMLHEDALLESAFVLVQRRRDVPGARAILDRLDQIDIAIKYTAFRVEAALARASGDEEAARAWIDAARVALARDRAARPELPWQRAEAFLALVETVGHEGKPFSKEA